MKASGPCTSPSPWHAGSFVRAGLVDHLREPRDRQSVVKVTGQREISSRFGSVLDHQEVRIHPG